jgi:hypothetical protein
VQDGPNTRFCRRKSLSDGQWKERAASVFVQVEVFVQSQAVWLNVNNKARQMTAGEAPSDALSFPFIILNGDLLHKGRA